ncbi:MAG: response regulator transcription factor [Firmicutes bacterium]|nr:response regulator transcription factor [Bacillota bacterium]
MITKFKDSSVRQSGVIYSGVFEQIKKLHKQAPEKAGELAISAIEYILTGEMSSDDPYMEIFLQPVVPVIDKDVNNYNEKVSRDLDKRKDKLCLDDIAKLYNEGYKQKEIAKKLKINEKTVSYRMGIIRSEYPELLNEPQRKKKEEEVQEMIEEEVDYSSPNFVF